MFFGVRTGKVLRALYEKKRLLIDMSKFKQFWILILCMVFASVVNIGETIWYINIENSTCYDSYVRSEDGNIVIFAFIRFFSHYIVIIACLIVFRFTNTERQSIIIADYARSELSHSYLDESNDFKSLKSTGRVNMTTSISRSDLKPS
ncbi:hypothetical protein SteCoe_17763 [Stentor coeruleus]|uniref:Uncharacterized protein n=1 Tax=Stentor coeruleus TaxID=5963 RepID=A0A1R2BY31_9CILI|nr:hypothetical protein SteCoe_17763 [Stentor coeruleus]